MQDRKTQLDDELKASLQTGVDIDAQDEKSKTTHEYINNALLILSQIESSKQNHFARLRSKGNLLLDLLDENDLLNFRLANQTTYQIASRLNGPYQNKQEFITANSNVYFSKKTLKEAVRLYLTTISTTNNEAAILHKRREGVTNNAKLLALFSCGDDLLKTTRIYDPQVPHAWNINAAWALAQIHKKRPFVMLSELYDTYIFRANGKYSALTKEITSAISKALYTIGNTKMLDSEYGFKHIIYLMPSTNPKMDVYQLTVKDLLEFSDTEFTHAIEEVISQISLEAQSNKMKILAGSIIEIFKQLEDEDTSVIKLKTVAREIKVQLEYIKKSLREVNNEKITNVKLFIEHYQEQLNKSTLKFAPQLQFNDQNFLNRSRRLLTIDKIYKTVFTAFFDHIDEQIENCLVRNPSLKNNFNL